MKLLYKLLLWVAIAATALPAAAYDFMVDGICYNINADGNTVTVTAERENYTPSYPNASGGSLTIPSSVYYNGKTYRVTAIGDNAFFCCWNFTGSLTIPNSVTSIGEYAFYQCRALTGSLTIPNSVTSIGENAFTVCDGFTGSLTIGNYVTSIGADAFNGCSGFTGSLTIPNSVTSIGNNAFWDCSGFNGSLTIGNSVTSIGSRAFSGCSGFTGSLTIPNSVTSIGIYAFQDCSGFTGSLTIGNSVTEIGQSAFGNCSGFTGSLTIGKSVTYIGSSAFYNCSGFTSINNYIPLPSYVSLGVSALSGMNKSTCTLYVPRGTVEVYRNAYQWKDFANIVEGTWGDNIMVTSISVSPSTSTLTVGGTATLTATVAPSNATNKNVTWTSSNTSVATVSGSGTTCTVTAKAAGTATITCTAQDGSGKTATCTVNVIQPVTSIAVSPSTATLQVGGATTLTATVSPSNATNPTVTWKSSNTTVATVSTSGVVTAKAAGTATITATTTDGTNLSATCTVTVTNPNVMVTSVTVSPSTSTLTVGSTATLTATVAPSNATNKNVTWTSSNTSVATVSGSGTTCTVIAKAAGTATITCTAQDGSGKKGTCTVTVTQPVTSVTVSPSTSTLTVGSTATLTATVLPSNATDKAVTWTSSNTSVATVDQSGVVTALSAGQTTITATTTDGTNLSSTCAVTVLQPVTSITVSPKSATLNVGQTTTLTATVLPSTATDKTVTWQSSNPDVVSITPDGTRCSVTAMAVGTATITVTTNDGSNLTASCPVTVNENVWNQPVMYLRPKGTMYCNWDNTGSGYIMPYVNTKPYDTVTWRNVSTAQGSPEWTYQLWNVESASSESHASNDRDLTVRYGNENDDVPTLTMGSAGSYTLSGYSVNHTTGAIEYSAVCRVAAATNSNMLCSAHYYGSSDRFGTEKYGWIYYSGAPGPDYDPEAQDPDRSGYWFGKNYGDWNVFGCGFEKPISPYVLNNIYFWVTDLEVKADVDLEARVYRVGDLPAYNDTAAAQIDPAMLTEANLIATGRTTITTDMNEDGSPILEFTLYETDPELGIEYEITPQIDDAIVIMILGMDQDAIQSITGLMTTDVEDEGVGEVTFLGAQQDGVITSCRGLNNFFSSGQMKAGSSILIDVSRPFITFNYNFEEGEYTFPASGGTMTQNVGGETFNGIDFYTTNQKGDWSVTNANGGSVPNWLTITLADEMENGEWTGVVNANVTAAALPYNLDYRDAFLRFAIHGAYIDYHFIQIYPGLRCDVNADGTLDVHDVNAVINLIMGYDTQFRDRADITTDGKVNVADLNAVINALLGRTTGAATNSRNMAKQGGLQKMKSGFTTSSGSSAAVMTRKNASVDAGSKADSATPRVNGKGQAQHVTAGETLVAPAVQLKARNPRP